jgi:UPF0755 protein
MKRFSYGVLVLLLLAGVGAAAGWFWLLGEIKPVASGDLRYFRFDDGVPLQAGLKTLQQEGFIKNAEAVRYYARIKGIAKPISSGTYELRPGMTVEELLSALQSPVKQMVRLPETTWAAQKAKVIADKDVAPADEYLALVHKPEDFEGQVSFPLPKGSLEGYLFPDTYDLPPLLGAKATILRQLKAFETKVWDDLGKPKDLQRAVIVASMVELEVMKDN